MQIQIPRKAELILKQLEAAGYEAYVVGGCVRDAILGRVPGDWDITTSAKPEEIKKVFRCTVDTGIQHGTVTVLIEGEPFEVTTYRIDGEYEDARHPKAVAFTASLQEDLRRRDFTINAMAYHPERGLVDLYGGLEDLKAGCIRCVGCAEERFGEDALRILRALRFSAQLGFFIENETRCGIEHLAETLKKISAERIQKEMTLLLSGKHCEMIFEAWKSGVTAVVLPEFDNRMRQETDMDYLDETVGECNIRAIKYARAHWDVWDFPAAEGKRREKEQVALQWALLLLGGEQAEARKVMNRLKFDNVTSDLVVRCIQYEAYPFELSEYGIRKAASDMGELLPLVLLLNEAKTASFRPNKKEEALNRLDTLHGLYQKMLEAGYATRISDLAVSGRDLLEAGVKPGKAVGETLHHLLELVLQSPEHNQREWLLAQLEKH